MPRKYGKKRTRRFRRKRYGKNKKYSTTISRLRDKSINTLLEKRMQEIAQAQVLKNIYRKYVFGAQDLDTNEFQTAEQVTWKGTVHHISSVEKEDVDQIVNMPEAFESEAPMEAMDNDGGLQGMIRDPVYGHRRTDVIKVQGLQIQMRVLLPFQVDASDAQVTLRWQVVAVKRPENMLAFNEPWARQLITWNPFGYSRKLDNAYTLQQGQFKKKKLLGGFMKLRYSTIRSQERFVTKYIRFPNPIVIQFLPAEQNGQIIREDSWKFFFVARSTCADANAATHAPTINVCSKLYYVEA